MPSRRNKTSVLKGVQYLSGNEAASEGAIAAGCRFYAGYPITPSSELMERMAARLEEGLIKGLTIREHFALANQERDQRRERDQQGDAAALPGGVDERHEHDLLQRPGHRPHSTLRAGASG